MRVARWLLLVLATVAGCAPQESPPEPVETLVVYSLDPWPLLPGDEQELEPGQMVFHKHTHRPWFRAGDRPEHATGDSERGAKGD